MDLLSIKEYVSQIAPATYELNIKINPEIMRLSFDTRTRLDFYEAFTEALSSNVYSFKKIHYPEEKISFYIDSGNLFAYNETVQKKYLEIFQSLNYKTDDIIDQAKENFSYRDSDQMKTFIKDFVTQHFSNHELEKEDNKQNTPRFRLFTLYEEIMQDMHHISIKINEKGIRENSSLSTLIAFDSVFLKELSKHLYELRKSSFPSERMSFDQKSGTLFTYSHEIHSTFLKVLKSLNKESYEIFHNFKESESSQEYLETYLSQNFLKWELEKTESNSKIKKIKV